MKFDFLDSFLAFTILSFLTGLIILILFQMDYLSYPHFLTNFTFHTKERGPGTTKHGITHGQPTQTSLRYGLHLPKTRSPPARTK